MRGSQTSRPNLCSYSHIRTYTKYKGCFFSLLSGDIWHNCTHNVVDACEDHQVFHAHISTLQCDVIQVCVNLV